MVLFDIFLIKMVAFSFLFLLFCYSIVFLVSDTWNNCFLFLFFWRLWDGFCSVVSIAEGNPVLIGCPHFICANTIEVPFVKTCFLLVFFYQSNAFFVVPNFQWLYAILVRALSWVVDPILCKLWLFLCIMSSGCTPFSTACLFCFSSF